jgi:antibiotic biosynthesis monooxygenase (ABM) superfamily enzyme
LIVESGSTDIATVVVTQTVKSGREADYRLWQKRTIEAARQFDGFQGAAMYPPSSAENREWVVVYRFETMAKLGAWVQSEERRWLLHEGRDYFDNPPTLEVLVGRPPPRDVITAVASHDVLPGKEREFIEWQARLTREQEKYPGFMGSELFPPVNGAQEMWVSLSRYDTTAHLSQWRESDARRKLLEEGRRYLRSYGLETVKSPFTGWFGIDDGPATAIPRWKQGMAVLLALYPTIAVLTRVAVPVFLTWQLPPPIRIFIVLSFSMIILSWFLMPLVNRALAFWLVPQGPEPRRTDLAGVALLLFCYFVLIFIAVLDFY